MADKKKDTNLIITIFGLILSGVIGYFSGQIGINNEINNIKLSENTNISDVRVSMSELKTFIRVNQVKIERNNKTIEKTYILIDEVNKRNYEIKTLLFNIRNTVNGSNNVIENR